jgi:hypothetical protein
MRMVDLSGQACRFKETHWHFHQSFDRPERFSTFDSSQ